MCADELGARPLRLTRCDRAVHHARLMGLLRAHLILPVLLAAACDGGQPGPSAMPAETSKAPPAPAAAAEPALFASKDGLVAAPRPTGDGWECVEQTAT